MIYEERKSLSKKDRRWLKVATNLAMSSSCNKKHGAVVVKGGSVLSVGVNKFRNNPNIIEEELIKDSCSVHAEIDALKKVKDAKGSAIYVARVNKFGKPLLSRPCNSCYVEIRRAGISRIVYTD